jgi:hypothetical protein
VKSQPAALLPGNFLHRDNDLCGKGSSELPTGPSRPDRQGGSQGTSDNRDQKDAEGDVPVSIRDGRVQTIEDGSAGASPSRTFRVFKQHPHWSRPKIANQDINRRRHLTDAGAATAYTWQSPAGLTIL